MKPITVEIVTLLEECPLFTGLEGDEIDRLLSASSARIRQFARNELVAQEGERVHLLNIVISGSVKGEMTDDTGKVIKIEDIVPPRPLAPAFLFGRQNRYPVQITANEPASLLAIPADEFLKMMQGSEQVLRNFINILSNRGQFLSGKLRFLTFSTLRAKLARYLLDLSLREGRDTFMLPLSQAGLAELFGVTRPSVGRAIGALNQEGIILTDGKAVSLLDTDRLRALLQEK